MTHALNEYLTNDSINLTMICRKYKIKRNDFINFLHENQYYAAGNGKKKQTVIALHDASLEYLNSKDKITFSYLSEKYKIAATPFKKYYIEHYGKKCWRANNCVFDNIDTEEKAYWLGFIYADGCISSSPINESHKYKQYTFEIGLQISDKNHLEKLKIFFNFKGNVEETDTMCRLRINDDHLWNTLNNYGCTPRKSLTLQFPNENIFSDKSLIRHFIRGYWDGDGCLSFKRKNYPCISVIGTNMFINTLIKYLPIEGKTYQNTESNTITKKLMYNGDNAFAITNYLYNNSNIYLNRKYDIYKAFCRIFEKSNIELQDNIGESCDANTEITTETKKSVAS